ncbi:MULTISPECIES: hypothetical protein [Candidatus Accumulibacter]|nr:MULTISPECIES: hypothetical protein [Candidatus Accumulibacter]MCM8620264.1 hypothetical protein [Accumulibacter sp.]HNC20619.1 hypothetical protein [Accumulibacter sp.]HNO14313.1 hypothetical protein [Accumulibacter sp.]HNO73007.1 hypothetical protein [Accumulibacter sp.]
MNAGRSSSTAGMQVCNPDQERPERALALFGSVTDDLQGSLVGTESTLERPDLGRQLAALFERQQKFR